MSRGPSEPPEERPEREMFFNVLFWALLFLAVLAVLAFLLFVPPFPDGPAPDSYDREEFDPYTSGP